MLLGPRLSPDTMTSRPLSSGTAVPFSLPGGSGRPGCCGAHRDGDRGFRRFRGGGVHHRLRYRRSFPSGASSRKMGGTKGGRRRGGGVLWTYPPPVDSFVSQMLQGVRHPSGIDEHRSNDIATSPSVIDRLRGVGGCSKLPTTCSGSVEAGVSKHDVITARRRVRAVSCTLTTKFVRGTSYSTVAVPPLGGIGDGICSGDAVSLQARVCARSAQRQPLALRSSGHLARCPVRLAALRSF